MSKKQGLLLCAFHDILLLFKQVVRGSAASPPREDTAMPKSKYNDIYLALRQRIEQQEYQGLIPSENTLIQEFACSRNTIRRAIQALATEGYVQAMQGKGVQVIYQPQRSSQFLLGGVESFTEACKRNAIRQETKVLYFAERQADREMERLTGFPVGETVYAIRRLRLLDGAPLIVDHNYFLKSSAQGLTPEIAAQSIYAYLEKRLGVVITTTKRVITVEPVTADDAEHLHMDGCNCVAVVSSSTYNSDGVMFEYTQSRHSPQYFEFHDIARRHGG